MAKYEKVVQSVAATIADYRAGEIDMLDEAHVERWANQVRADARHGVLAELDHVLKHTYVPKKRVTRFLRAMLDQPKLAGDVAKATWSRTRFLDIQTAGHSQSDMLSIVATEINDKFALRLGDCGVDNPQRYVYVDDFLYSGGRIRHDITGWIADAAPKVAELHIVVMGFHRYGQWSAANAITKAAEAAGKAVKVTWWRIHEIEDRKFKTDACDVLRPTAVPADRLVQAHVAGQGGQPILRKSGDPGPLELYTGDEGKILLEQELWVGGLRVLEMCPYLREKRQMRALGSSFFDGAGFGSLFVTYRNCANNTPLMLWAGQPWYPLFPRKTN